MEGSLASRYQNQVDKVIHHTMGDWAEKPLYNEVILKNNL